MLTQDSLSKETSSKFQAYKKPKFAIGSNTDPKTNLNVFVRNGVKYGFENFELQLEYKSRKDHKNPGILAELVTLQLEYGLTFTGHAPYHKTNLASENNKDVNDVIDVLPFMAALRAKKLTVHTGLEHEDRERSFKNLSQSLKTLVSVATEYGIQILLETSGREGKFLTLSPEQYKSLCDNTGCTITADLIHLQVLHPNTFLSVVNQLLPYIQNIHIADRYEDLHQHNPLGYGTFCFEEVFSLLQVWGYKEQITVDAMSSNYSSHLYLKNGMDFKAYYRSFFE